MKKALQKFLTAVILLCIIVAIAACSDAGKSLSTSSSEAGIEYTSQEESNGNALKVSELKSLAATEKITVTDSKKISEEDCIKLAKQYYPDVCAILSEFYGSPKFLKMTNNGPIAAGEVHYSQVKLAPNNKIISSIAFENDAAKLREVVDEYFTDNLIETAFNLEYPCPIYEEDGILYRTVFEEGDGYHGCDFESGRIISNENGCVRFGFPIYSIDFDSNEVSKDFWIFGYFDFVYEDSNWKINDLRIASEQYSYDDFPGGNADIRMDDFFEIADEYEQNGIAVELKDDRNVAVTIDGKRFIAELTSRASSIKKVERIGGNLFVSFNCIFDEAETVVFSENENEVIAQFVSSGYCTNAGGNWYYIKLDRENRLCDIYDWNGNAVCGFVTVRQPDAVYKSLPEIAPIADFYLTEDGFSIIYNETAYRQIESNSESE